MTPAEDVPKIGAVNREFVSEREGQAGSPRLRDVPPGLWREVGAAAHRLLILDYDGTLAPFRVVRSEALPVPGARAALRQLARSPRTRLAIVSGRPIAELEELLGPLRAVLVGEHGWETRLEGGAVVRHPVSSEQQEALGRAAIVAATAGWGERLERKRTGVVLHTRGLPPEVEEERVRLCRELWEPECRHGLRQQRVHGGLELRAAGRDKGSAVLELLQQLPEDARAVYVGDDQTDEDAFRALLNTGFGLRVGADDRPTLAQGRLEDPEAVAEFLAGWRTLAGEADPASGAAAE